MSKAKGFGAQRRRGAGGIRFGTDELINLDAVAPPPPAADDGKLRSDETGRGGGGADDNAAVVGGGGEDGNTQGGDEKNPRRRRPFGNQQQQQAQKSTSHVSPPRQQEQQASRRHHASLAPSASASAALMMPPEARLPRWTFVFRSIFKSSQAALVAEALDRIERWKRMTATHGMMMRLRKIPAYIEATKVLVEALQTDRLLEKARNDFWSSITKNSKENNDAGNVVYGDDDDDADDDDEAVSYNDDDGADDVDDDATTTHIEPKKATTAPSSSVSSSPSPMPLLGTSTLPMLYASAVSRAVFEMTESDRRYSDHLSNDSTFRQRAQAISLPQELTEARNMIAHGRMPTLAQLRFATSLGLQYLYKLHWQVKDESLKEFRGKQQKQQQKQEQQQHRRGGDDDDGRSNKQAVAVTGQKKKEPTAGDRRQREEQHQQQQQQRTMLSLEELRSKVSGLLNTTKK